ncbi:TPA: hypothetical protein ACK3Q6_002698 [Burkholderia cepacia]|uniref:Uncharacterized protein n=1 Tax=Burkholderia cenocepacia TaxID=95486 RepID=A0ABD4UD25_9BURK|nr:MULTISPECIES: hypothetical protein [Burkholderia cepacia complex]HDR9764015.1 hypothetical protein [Burkholderia cepacia ATCC 25416]MCA8361193.1 hypothetical protein [Burkholderia cepacia]MCW3498640.1 hypothetical protein [Burkholderia cenocepacia]MCW3506272.1 hypothetical protein [Burkholderia cenocepacia]MCW3513793.1 hypothetical protein [Burkholderia cenocepacia]
MVLTLREKVTVPSKHNMSPGAVMIERFCFHNYRAKDIKQVPGVPGWTATIIRDGKVLGVALDKGNGEPVDIRFNDVKDHALLCCDGKSMFPNDHSFMHDALFLKCLVMCEIAVSPLTSKSILV